ncbi:MAG: ribonuclease HI [Spirochaetota bacterium]
MDAIIVYTDGGCSGNPGPGGWAYIIQREKEKLIDSGAETHTTNNRMELTAVIKALERILESDERGKSRILIKTDSQYVQKGVGEWLARWQKNGWKTSDKKEVKNQDLWKKLVSLSAGLKIDWHWVKGHNGESLNEECDALVGKAIAR